MKEEGEMRCAPQWRRVAAPVLILALLLTTAAFGQNSEAGASAERGNLALRLEAAVAAEDVQSIQALLNEAAGASEAAVQPLIPFLNHYNQKVVECSALALVRNGSPDAIAAVIARTRKASSAAERENLVTVLKGASNPAGAQPFFTLLQDPDAETMYEIGVQVLTSMGTPQIISEAEALLATNPIERVRRNTLRIVGGISNPASTEYISAALARSQDRPLKSALAVALGKIGTQESIDALVRQYDRGDETDKEALARGISYVNRDAALPILSEMLVSTKPEALLQGAARALRNFSRPDLIAEIDRLAAISVSPLVRSELLSSREAILSRANAPEGGRRE